MKYFVDIAGRTIELELELRADGAYEVRGPGGTHRVDYLETNASEVSVRIDGRSRTFWFMDTRTGVVVHDERATFDVRAVDEPTRLSDSIFGKKGGGRGTGEIRSVMPGIVTRVLVQEGDSVEPGMPLLCIEAMKMENEVKAETTGVVKRLLVAKGKTVSAGEALVEIA